MALLGPTASGKTAVAIRLAHHYQAEIISVDSMQVYRGMDIGTAKPTILERDGVPHHLIDLAEPEDEFSVAEFSAFGRKLIEESVANTLIITGGSGLHFRSLVDPMSFAPTDRALRADLEATDTEKLEEELLRADPVAATHVDLANSRRLVRAVEIMRLTGETPSARYLTAEAERIRRYESDIDFIGAGVDPGPELEKRVKERVAAMRERGLLDEVRGLAGRLGRTARSAVGYRELLPVVIGKADPRESFAAIERNTLRLAGKQRTWFQRDPRIRWIPWHDAADDRMARLIETYE